MIVVELKPNPGNGVKNTDHQTLAAAVRSLNDYSMYVILVLFSRKLEYYNIE